MNLHFENIQNYKLFQGNHLYNLQISYELFGQDLHTAPIVIVNHALTGNSDVLSSEKGWWKEIVGYGKLIDLNRYTVIAFNIPGNGYDGTYIEDYHDFTAKDVAVLFHKALTQIKVDKVYAIIGGSLGGGIAWEMASLYRDFADYIIPIASNYRANDWIIGHNHVQESILQNSRKPLQDARKMAMLFYRTPQSFKRKFHLTKVEGEPQYNVESWLIHHGKKLEERFDLRAYLFMNHLFSSINAISEGKTFEETFRDIKSTIIQISVNSDLLFSPEENEKTKEILDHLNIKNEYYQIKSIDGHDAFLIEHEQLTNLLSPIFKN